jgi:hypothetical protein
MIGLSRVTSWRWLLPPAKCDSSSTCKLGTLFVSVKYVLVSIKLVCVHVKLLKTSM